MTFLAWWEKFLLCPTTSAFSGCLSLPFLCCFISLWSSMWSSLQPFTWMFHLKFFWDVLRAPLGTWSLWFAPDEPSQAVGSILYPYIWKSGSFYLRNCSLTCQPAPQQADVCMGISSLDESNLPKANAGWESSLVHLWSFPEPRAATFDVYFVIRKEKENQIAFCSAKLCLIDENFCWLKAFSDVSFALSY